ncbi:hypothetical protein As57867_004865, partial [Aphanomyces stellatus]
MNILALIAIFAAAVAAAPCTNTDFVALAPQALGCALASGLTAPPASVADFVTKDVAALCAKDACKGLVSAVSALSCSVDPQGVLPNSAITCDNAKAVVQVAANATQTKPVDATAANATASATNGTALNGTNGTTLNSTAASASNSTSSSTTTDSTKLNSTIPSNKSNSSTPMP